MTDPLNREALRLEGINASWTHVTGVLAVEAPASIMHMQARGSCAVGAFTYSDRDCELNDCEVGRYCSIGAHVILGPGEHPLDFLTTHPIATDGLGRIAGFAGQPLYIDHCLTEASRPVPGRNRTTIGSDVWIGSRAIVSQGVTVGMGAVIASGSVVTRDVPPFAIVAGAPARVLRYRFDEQLIERIVRSQWWTLDLSCLPKRDFADVDGFLSELERLNPPTKTFTLHLLENL